MTRKKTNFGISRKISVFLAVLLFAYSLAAGVFSFALYMSDNIKVYSNNALIIAKSAGIKSGDIANIEGAKSRLGNLTDNTEAVAVYILGQIDEGNDGDYYLFALGNAEISAGTTIKAAALAPEAEIAFREERDVYSRIYETFGERVITGFVPVFDDSGNLAAVVGADIGVESLYASALRFAVREAAISFALVLALSLIGYLIAGRIFGRRMKLISDAAEKIASGDFNIDVPLNSKSFSSDDEISAAARNLQTIGNVINTIAAGLPGYENTNGDENIPGQLTGIFNTIEQTINKSLSIIENIDSLVYVSDIESYELLFANRRLLEFAGFSHSSEIEGKKCWEVIHKGKDPCAFCPVQRLMADTSRTVYEREHYDEEAKRWFLSQSSLIRWADGKTAHFEVATDITKLKAYEEKMKHLSAIIATSDSGIVVNDRRGIIQEWNIGATHILGYERYEVIGRSPKEFHRRENYGFVEDVISRLVAGEHIHNPEEMRIHKDGRKVYCSITYTPFLDNKGLVSGYVSVFHDVSERVKKKRLQEDALHKAVLNAEETSHLKSMFLANMSHEIRTPMNGIIGLTELALEGGGLSEKTTDYLTKIQSSATGLLDIINDILDISKIESGKTELENVAFTLGDVFKSCEVISELKEKGKNVQLIIDSGELATEVIIGDPTKLRQVFMNLLSNAIKFTNSGSVVMSARLVKKDEDSLTVTFTVKDTGIGMNGEEVERALEPFRQADVSTTRRYGGTGLGLSITSSLLEIMGGALQIESEPGTGSTFSFTLIFKAAGKSTPVAVYFGEDLDRENANKKPIFAAEALVCEDNSINRQVIEEHLMRIGINPVIAENGKIGVNMAKTRMRTGKPFDIILMDIHMPVMDGLEAMQKLIEAGSETPVIAMTANAMREDRELVLQSGMSEYICKPFTARDLWSCLLRFLRPVRFEDVVSDGSTGDKNEIIDGVSGLEKSAGDPGLYKKIKIDFYFKNLKTIETIGKAAASGDFKTAHRLTHTLKGVATLIGANRLGEAAEEAEKIYAESRADERILSLMRERLDAVLNQLAPLAEEARKEGEKAGSGVQTNLVKALDIINRLEPLLREGSSEATDFADEVRNAFSKEHSSELVLYLLDYEFDAALKELIKIKRQLEGE
ncbi:MAG: PAS domain S-box protein [Oscillospiraceae bacterium]|jgi:PAS domain S-box-containing protein|nr:PAS domain S-box protein [Oscillospiraceae bacterium]